MLVRLNNNKRQIDYGVNEAVNLDQYSIYDSERKASGKVRLMFNISVVTDGSLFNPITEYVDSNNIRHFGIDGQEVTDLNKDNAMFGVDILDTLPIRCIEQPYMTSTSSDNPNNFVIQNTKRSYKTCLPVFYTWENAFNNIHINSTRYNEYHPESNDENLFMWNNFYDFNNTVNRKLLTNGGEFGFLNPIFTKKTFSYSYEDKNKGMLDETPGSFISLCPGKEYYSFTETYNKHNKLVEPNWLSYITYPSDNSYPDDYFRELHSEDENYVQGIRHGLIIWMIDELSDEITYFRTKTKNGFLVGDVVNVYSGTSLLLSSVEVVSKPDDYTFGIANNGQKIKNWTFSKEINYVGKKYTTAYESRSNLIYCYYDVENEGVITAYTSYNDNLCVVRVENFVECDYYVKMHQQLYTTRLINKKNSFSKNVYGIDNGYLMNENDIDINELTDNLGRPVTELYLTVVKENYGNEEWYTSEDDTNDPLITRNSVSHSHCFGPVRGGYELDPYIKSSDSITWITKDTGIPINDINDGGSEVDNGEFHGDICEYSPSVFKETTIQPFMHRVNTAQRDCLNDDLTVILHDIDYDVSEKINTQRYKPLVTNVTEYRKKLSDLQGSLSIGYVYKPNYRIRIKTFKNELRTEFVENYGVVGCSLGYNETITYGSETSSITVFKISLDTSNRMKLMTPVILYFKSVDGTEYDVKFMGKVVAWYEDTIVGITLTNPEQISDCNEHVIRTFTTQNGDKMYVVVENTAVPSYAQFACDGGFYYRWSEVEQNGYDEASGVPTYPFANGAFYIEDNICIYLRRQRDIIKSKKDTVIPTSEEESGGGSETSNVFKYEPSSVKVETIDSNYNDTNEVKEIESCGNIEEEIQNYITNG